MSNIGKIIRVDALPPAGERENNVIYQVAAPGAATYTDYAVDENGDIKTHSGNFDPQDLVDSAVNISTQELIDEGINTQKDFNNITRERLVHKLDKPYMDGTVQEYPKVLGLDSNGNTATLPAGDLGKNIANSSLTSVAGSGLTLGADWALETAGHQYSISGLNDVSTDPEFDTFLSQNDFGKLGKTNGIQPFLSLPNTLNDDEKTQWKTAMNGGWTTNTMSVGLIFPSIIAIDPDPNSMTFITLIGSNLNLNPTNFSIEIIDLNGNIIHTIDNSKVSLLNPNSMNLRITTSDYPSGEYRIKLNNGVAEYITPISIALVDPLSINDVDITSNVWTRVVYNNMPFNAEVNNTYNELSFGRDANVAAAVANDNAVLVAYYMDGNFISTTDDFTIDGEMTTLGVFNPFGGSIGFGISADSTNLSTERITGIVSYGSNSGTFNSFKSNGSGTVNLSSGQSAKFIISKKGNYVTTYLYKSNGETILETVMVDNSSSQPIRFKVFATNFMYNTESQFNVKINKIRKLN